MASFCFFYESSTLGEDKGNQMCLSQDDHYTYYECSGTLCTIGTTKTERKKEVLLPSNSINRIMKNNNN